MALPADGHFQQWRGLAALQSEGVFSTLPPLSHTPFSSNFSRIFKPMNTVFAKAGQVRGDWFVVDAAGKTLGRLATQLAHRLRGKHKPEYTPHVDTGDHLVVINAEKIRVTGAKLNDKWYHHHTGYLGNLKSIHLGKLLKEHPERAIEFAVQGMLPKNPLGRKMFKKLHVFAGDKHPHAAQQPKTLEI
jgi:large subunit ribosomal protein L13